MDRPSICFTQNPLSRHFAIFHQEISRIFTSKIFFTYYLLVWYSCVTCHRSRRQTPTASSDRYATGLPGARCCPSPLLSYSYIYQYTISCITLLITKLRYKYLNFQIQIKYTLILGVFIFTLFGNSGLRNTKLSVGYTCLYARDVFFRASYAWPKVLDLM